MPRRSTTRSCHRVKALALPKQDWPLIAAGGVLLAVAYPPFHLLLPSFACVIPVVWLITQSADDARPLRRRLVQGFWYGLVSQGLVLYWLVIALWHFTPLSLLAYVATILVYGLYHAGLFAIVGWVGTRTRLSLLVVLPICWTALEWWLGHAGDVAFPWLGLGTSLTGFPMLVQIADVVGARGVTFLLVLANVALALALPRWREPRAIRTFVAVGAGVVVALGYGALRARAIPIRPVGTVALVQPNIGFQEKWEAEFRDSIFERLISMSAEAMRETSPQLVVWPEAAIPGYLANRPAWDRAISLQARAAGIPILAGGLDVEWYGSGPQDYDYWNAAFFIDADGQRNDTTYHKRYLVPITERVPFVNPRWFDLDFFGGFAIGRQAPLFESDMGRFGIIICYESAFEDRTRQYRMRGADWIVNITNDAWFGRTSAPRQHFAHLVMRAIENRVGIARAGNNGISGFVDPLGRAYGLTRLDERLITADVLVTSDTRTLYTRLGDWVGLFSIVGTVLLVGTAWRRRS